MAATRGGAGSTVARARSIARALLRWYARNGRSLAFRATRDPYAVLVAEVMSQQTQVARVGPAWSGFLTRFPDARRLAEAPTADVIRAWTGLGYNRRAVDLQRAVRAALARHGRIPETVEELAQLPGVGPYTARAVAAIAFGVPVAAVDTNIRRVTGRLMTGYGRPGDGGHRLAERELQAAADGLVDAQRPADWTHAAMDLGALVCRPVPDCARCPLRAWCAYAASRARGIDGPSTRPLRSGTKTRPSAAFPTTSRWLRGSLIETLRSAPPGAWVEVDGAIGGHDRDAVARAVQALERDGLLERDARGAVRLPS